MKPWKKAKLKFTVIYYLLSLGSFLIGILLAFAFAFYVTKKASHIIPVTYALGAIWSSLDNRLSDWRHWKIIQAYKRGF